MKSKQYLTKIEIYIENYEKKINYMKGKKL